MIGVIHNHGTSFKGLMAYLMHDADHAPTSERVSWTHTSNLATDDPELGWRTMAATAMSQEALKAEAGIANTGRKSKKHVMHYTLSWHDEERQDLTRDEMMQAALASMTYIGTHEGERFGKRKAVRTQYADEHQAVIVCHDEPGKSPHVHIALNRVHPTTGVILPDSKDYEKLSAWALEYRQAQGKEHYCPQRQKNAAKRAQGYLTSHRRKSRGAYEAEQEQKAADPGSRKAALLEVQRRRAGELQTKKKEMEKQHAAAFRKLETQHVKAETFERVKAAERIRAGKAKIKARVAPKIDALTERHQEEIQTFRDAKKTALGHVRNTWAALKTKQWMTEIRTRPLRATSNAFKLALSSGLQQRDIEKHHARERRELNGKRRGLQRAAAREVRSEERVKLEDHRDQFAVRRNDLILGHAMENAKLKAEWTQLQRDRLATLVEDERSPLSRSNPAGEVGRPAGHRQDQKKDQAPLADKHAEQSQARQPVNDNAYDERLEELRDAARLLRELNEKQQQDHEKDQGRERE